MSELTSEELSIIKDTFYRKADLEKKGIVQGESEPIQQAVSSEAMEKVLQTIAHKWSREDLTGLEVAFKKLAESFERAFVSISRKDCKVVFKGFSISCLENDVFTLPEGFYSNIFSLDPLVGKAAVIIDPWFSFFLVYSILSGDPPDTVERAINELEGEMLYHALSDKLEQSLVNGFEDMFPLNPKAIGFKTRAQTLYICDGKEEIAIAEYDVFYKEQAHAVRFVLPLRPFEMVKNYLISPYQGDREKRVVKDLERVLRKVDLEVQVEVASVELSLADLLAIKDGDVITLGKGYKENVYVKVEGVRKYMAIMGKKNGVKAVRIVQES